MITSRGLCHILTSSCLHETADLAHGGSNGNILAFITDLQAELDLKLEGTLRLSTQRRITHSTATRAVAVIWACSLLSANMSRINGQESKD